LRPSGLQEFVPKQLFNSLARGLLIIKWSDMSTTSASAATFVLTSDTCEGNDKATLGQPLAWVVVKLLNMPPPHVQKAAICAYSDEASRTGSAWLSTLPASVLPTSAQLRAAVLLAVRLVQ
jgi:hypothetical protein